MKENIAESISSALWYIFYILCFIAGILIFGVLK